MPAQPHLRSGSLMRNAELTGLQRGAVELDSGQFRLCAARVDAAGFGLLCVPG